MAPNSSLSKGQQSVTDRPSSSGFSSSTTVAGTTTTSKRKSDAVEKKAANAREAPAKAARQRCQAVASASAAGVDEAMPGGQIGLKKPRQIIVDVPVWSQSDSNKDAFDLPTFGPSQKTLRRRMERKFARERRNRQKKL